MKLSTALLCFVALAAAGALPPAVAAAEIGADRDQAFGRNVGVTVKGIRLGRHPDKLRIVLDATGPLNFDYWISEGGKAIVVLIPQVEWAAAGYLRFGEDSRIYRIRFFPSPSGGGVLSILGREKLGLSAVEEIGPEGERPYRMVFDIPVRRQDAWLPDGGIMRSGKLLPAHREWPPVMRAAAGRPLPVITRRAAAAAPLSEHPVSYANR